MGDESVEGTELEKIEAQKDADNTIFADAFDVAEKGDGVPEGDAPVKSAADTGKETEGAKPAPAAKADEPSADTDPNKGQPVKSAKDDEETYKARWESLDGIVKARDKKYDEDTATLKKQIDDLTAVVNVFSEKSKKDADKSKSTEDDLTDDQKKILDEYDKEFDTVSKMEGMKREKALSALEKKIKAELKTEFDDEVKKIREEFSTKVDPITKSIQESDKVLHFSSIETAHPGYEKYRDDGSILKWIGTKPRYMQPALKSTYESGTAEDVIELLTDFKKENNLLEDNDKQPDDSNLIDLNKKKEEKKKNLTAVPLKNGSINLKQASKDDFEGAFDEAVKKS
jgi:hypothetical protein